jgi:hypothetical protein
MLSGKEEFFDTDCKSQKKGIFIQLVLRMPGGQCKILR